MHSLQGYNRAEDVKKLMGLLWEAVSGVPLARDHGKILFPLKPGTEFKYRMAGAILSTARDLPKAPNEEKAQEVIAHLSLAIAETFAKHSEELAFQVASFLQGEAGLATAAASRNQAKKSFCQAIKTGRESDLLQSMSSYWK